jgi:ATP/ADP translocase
MKEDTRNAHLRVLGLSLADRKYYPQTFLHEGKKYIVTGRETARNIKFLEIFGLKPMPLCIRTVKQKMCLIYFEYESKK